MLKIRMYNYFVCFAALMLVFALHTQAQVTIGSDYTPVSGALLDLKEHNTVGENSTRGFILPRVNLEEADNLAPCVDETAFPNERANHTGLMVYNMATVLAQNLCPGVYLWTSEKWKRLHGSCEAPEISNLAVSYVMDGLEHRFNVRYADEWVATISDPNAILASTSALNGNAGTTEFKFTTNVTMDADATATITFSKKSNPDIKNTATINGIKMIFEVPYFPIISASLSTNREIPFEITTNSTRPILFENMPSFLQYDAVGKNMIAIGGNKEPDIYIINVTNTAVSYPRELAVIGGTLTVDEPRITELEPTYVMDGLEHSFYVWSDDDWKATISDPNNILASTSPLTGVGGYGVAGRTEFKFTTNVKMDADASATITFIKKENPTLRTVVTINGVKMTLTVPGNITASATQSDRSLPFVITSNSTRPITVVCTNPAVYFEYDAAEQLLKFFSTNPAPTGRHTIEVSNGAATREVELLIYTGTGTGN